MLPRLACNCWHTRTVCPTGRHDSCEARFRLVNDAMRKESLMTRTSLFTGSSCQDERFGKCCRWLDYSNSKVWHFIFTGKPLATPTMVLSPCQAILSASTLSAHCITYHDAIPLSSRLFAKLCKLVYPWESVSISNLSRKRRLVVELPLCHFVDLHCVWYHENKTFLLNQAQLHETWFASNIQLVCRYYVLTTADTSLARSQSSQLVSLHLNRNSTFLLVRKHTDGIVDIHDRKKTSSWDWQGDFATPCCDLAPTDVCLH